jgi:hypothetical protein
MVNPREATYAGGALGVLDDSLLATELTWGEHLVKFVNPNVEDDVPEDYRRLLSVRELAPETFSDDDMEEICEQFRDQAKEIDLLRHPRRGIGERDRPGDRQGGSRRARHGSRPPSRARWTPCSTVGYPHS